MQKYATAGLVALMTLLSLAFFGCSRQPAQGKLQVMFSGNIRGNVSPCG